MLNEHRKIWGTLDKIAYIHDLSASGLARLAGLDPTAFNRSKRKYPSGKPRWPSTESVCKVLHATHTTWPQFITYLESIEDAGADDDMGELKLRKAA
jgi:phage repressor protein C with HTH and peptisase S24 domain